MKANKFFAIALAALALMACNKKDEPQPEKLKVTPEVAEVSVNATVQLTANMDVTWSSSDDAIASVNDKGLVTGNKEGEATITAKAKTSNELATCKVTVTKGGVTPPQVNISVTDNSIEDWKALPEDKVASCACPNDATMDALKGAAVYADAIYIYILVEYDPEQIVDREWPAFHVYINTDMSDATGGYSDEFADPNADVLLETAIFASGEPNNYNPAVFKWWGEVGGAGWAWTEHWQEEGYYQDGDGLKWGAIVGEGELPIGNSQIIQDKYIEIQLLRELIPSDAGWNENEFGIGFDIQQNWASVGFLPQDSPTDANPAGHANKLTVKINK